ncbi:hypothetical protein E2C01_066439 [Portunus trituberculatus]|uniref:Uncharacterized protein n=1 Tax=Portunus trituberculatus TaxID=210409 RepID=A0A5B7HR16_PORTR|nr:hypothetical protein [Portunus trituberculatus]
MLSPTHWHCSTSTGHPLADFLGSSQNPDLAFKRLKHTRVFQMTD